MSEKDRKTEKPTQWRLQKAKDKGDVPRSRELGSSVSLLLSVLLFAMFMSYSGNIIIKFMKSYFNIITDWEIDINRIGDIYNDSFIIYIKLLLPLFLVLIFAAFIVNILQGGGFKINTENLKFNFSKFNIIKGLKKIMFSVETIAELIKSILKVVIIGGIAYITVHPYLTDLINLPQTTIANILHVMGKIFFSLVFNIVIFLLILSILDYIWAKYRYMQRMKMTKDEVKDEYKQREGDPKIKSKQRGIQYQKAIQRMMAEVPKADVVITNPDHYAVALKYEYKKMKSPKLVAKGKNLVAERIKKVAKENNVPVVENPPLARGLFFNVEVNEFIPSEFFKPVAEVLAYIYKLKGKGIG